MKVIERTYTEEVLIERDFQGDAIEIEIDGKIEIIIREGEPEDMTLSRDLSDVHTITRLLKMAYEAGRNGEEFTYQAAELID